MRTRQSEGSSAIGGFNSRGAISQLRVIDGRAYVIVYTMRGSLTRIIAARKANGKEVANHKYNARQD